MMPDKERRYRMFGEIDLIEVIYCEIIMFLGNNLRFWRKEITKSF